MTSRVSSSKQAHVRPGPSKPCCKHLNFSLYRTPTPKTPRIDSLAPILFPPAPTSSTKLKQIHNTTDSRSSATHNHFATNFSCNQPTHQQRQRNLPTTSQPTATQCKVNTHHTAPILLVRHLRRSVMQAHKGPCSDTNCECEKRLTSRVSSSKQAHVRPGTSKTCPHSHPEDANNRQPCTNPLPAGPNILNQAEANPQHNGRTLKCNS